MKAISAEEFMAELVEIRDELERLVNVECVFEIDTTPETLRAEFAQFQPQHEVDNNFLDEETAVCAD